MGGSVHNIDRCIYLWTLDGCDLRITNCALCIHPHEFIALYSKAAILTMSHLTVVLNHCQIVLFGLTLGVTRAVTAWFKDNG